jgi:hypothetical protein
MIERAKGDGQIEWVIPHLADTILFMKHDINKAKNLKLILSAFEQLWNLKINFYKSELFRFGEAQADVGSKVVYCIFCKPSFLYSIRFLHIYRP